MSMFWVENSGAIELLKMSEKVLSKEGQAEVRMIIEREFNICIDGDNAGSPGVHERDYRFVTEEGEVQENGNENSSDDHNAHSNCWNHTSAEDSNQGHQK